ncbi:MAG: hypothetical protein A2381_03750 [Bdellovibrionales bacterium RIFOXYB1_FULL_37_110]|nr:MAG: hypothetical protein A2417_16345 [Bdellovibrionales bacterium RIFOXYC1_FULL_37_79]OFZ59150.1 MAG: hypothetical protein A2381_03750 [Bdellovibrionales bacterium RIFOXYB1_FULL_37_110]OFZ64155.1 MAG: hypothetical protein A2577_14780 [Bdellovibrionales bacterium RIFOXYD1_FULL_36_51]
MPVINERHPFNIIDDLFEDIDNQNISRENLALAVRIVLMILWDETVAFQLDIACSNEQRFIYSDNFVLSVFKEDYLPRFKGIKIDDEQIRIIYDVAKKVRNLEEFENDVWLNVVRMQIIESNMSLSGLLTN